MTVSESIHNNPPPEWMRRAAIVAQHRATAARVADWHRLLATAEAPSHPTLPNVATIGEGLSPSPAVEIRRQALRLLLYAAEAPRPLPAELLGHEDTPPWPREERTTPPPPPPIHSPFPADAVATAAALERRHRMVAELEARRTELLTARAVAVACVAHGAPVDLLHATP
jgi:hypothetical protein